MNNFLYIASVILCPLASLYGTPFDKEPELTKINTKQELITAIENNDRHRIRAYFVERLPGASKFNIQESTVLLQTDLESYTQDPDVYQQLQRFRILIGWCQKQHSKL